MICLIVLWALYFYLTEHLITQIYVIYYIIYKVNIDMDFSVTSVYINVSMYLYCLSASACISFAKSFWIFLFSSIWVCWLSFYLIPFCF